MTSRPFRVVVVGGGFAAAEALLALRNFAGDHVEIELVTAEPELPFRPAATTAAFRPATASRPAAASRRTATAAASRPAATTTAAAEPRLLSTVSEDAPT